ncbi:MAG: hypothetical protein HY700_17780 [Gemmatimonadetes bacterium]|nr:hypothetical protein [Gemmatimonadota bacterium]
MRIISQCDQRALRVTALGALCGILCTAPQPAAAQIPWNRKLVGASLSGAALAVNDSLRGMPPWVSPVASAVLPGMGQLVRGDHRGAIYFIAEAFLVQRFVSLQSEARREKNRYHDIALKVARAPFGPEIRDTVFEYFEQMGKFVESGPFDTDPGPQLVPPIDESTYNGSIWALARRTYIGNSSVPADTALSYQAALAFYRSRAIGPGFRWSWRNAGIEQDLFRQTIQRGDETFRRATQQLGLLLANHFLSAVDAFVSQRLSRRGLPVNVDHSLIVEPRTGTARVGLEVGIGF